MLDINSKLLYNFLIMKYKANLYYLSIIITIFLFFNCLPKGPEYNFDFPPPYINARMNEVFPTYIRQQRRVATKMDLPEGFLGYNVNYLDGDIIMQVIKAPSEEAVKDYFNNTVVPRFKSMPESSTSETDGWLHATGIEKEGRRWIGWINQIWIFQMSGTTEEYFDLVIRACRFIEKKE